MQLALRISELIVQGLRSVVAVLIVIFFSYMVLAVLAQVLGRYVFSYSIAGAVETATFSQIWMIFLAAGLAMRRKLHVGIDVLYMHLPRLLQRVIAIAILAVGLWFLWTAIMGSFQLIRIGMVQTSPALSIPMWLPYLSLPVGLSYFALEFFVSYLHMIYGPGTDAINEDEGEAT
ncbi:TRAP transporter small permease [Marinobacterium rhizophilum]|uniref:TRAP transporter small permease n=1 Tax=Marinobacterium rhizophilum TaxID=420402 RepID=UPI000375A715|nr:TRAP transporter small permease [Marinobacterium rhizophilum]